MNDIELLKTFIGKLLVSTKEFSIFENSKQFQIKKGTYFFILDVVLDPYHNLKVTFLFKNKIVIDSYWSSSILLLTSSYTTDYQNLMSVI